MKSTLCALITVAALGSAVAHATEFSCTTNSLNGTAEVSVSKSRLTVRASGDVANAIDKKEVVATHDESYNPRPQHAGSQRYNASNSCGPFSLIIDKAMASGKAGKMTFQQDCDSDGTGPSYTVYDCR